MLKMLCQQKKWLALAVFIIFLDQLSKWLVVSYLYPGQVLSIFPGFNLTLVFNRGMAFSLLSDGNGWQRWFLGMVAVIVSGGILWWMKKNPEKACWLRLGLMLILGGAIGNLIDRITYGYVIDFLDVYLMSWHWPAFNIADSAITAGAGCLLMDFFLAHRYTAEHSGGSGE